MAFKQYRISDLIKRLQELKKEHGNLKVELSCDEEGNSFSPLGDVIGDDGDMIPFGIYGDDECDNEAPKTRIVIYPV